MNDVDLMILKTKVATLETLVQDQDVGRSFRSAEWFPKQEPEERHSNPILSIPFLVTKTGPLAAILQPGTVELGPATRLTWDGKRIINGTEDAASGCFVNNLTDGTKITIPQGSTEWHVWANIDIRDGQETWELFEGSSITPLTDSETQGANVLKNTLQRIIANFVISSNAITTWDNPQCGAIHIQRL